MKRFGFDSCLRPFLGVAKLQHRGPVVCLKDWHPTVLKFCSMHVVNLGICYGVCGCALAVKPKLTGWGLRPRVTLVDCAHWGHVEESFEKRLDAAYAAFRAFTKAQGIQCSQPPFTPKMVPLQKFLKRARPVRQGSEEERRGCAERKGLQHARHSRVAGILASWRECCAQR